MLTVFIVPFALHQLSTNLIEPKILADSLDLHPIVILISLAFWTTVWGAMGAVMSVPLTAVARLVLAEVDHPYSTPIVWMLKGGRRGGDKVSQKGLMYPTPKQVAHDHVYNQIIPKLVTNPSEAVQSISEGAIGDQGTATRVGGVASENVALDGAADSDQPKRKKTIMNL